ncbi:hypothetical protein KCP77_16795 [Salmonella enterica subsp. enterica]|nr:hypothetical protein KCP77_16795 [Salmonella enterica subsp. enterica]
MDLTSITVYPCVRGEDLLLTLCPANTAKWPGFCASSGSSPKTMSASDTPHSVQNHAPNRQGEMISSSTVASRRFRRIVYQSVIRFRQCFSLLVGTDRAKTIRCVNLMGKRFPATLAHSERHRIPSVSPAKTATLAIDKGTIMAFHITSTLTTTDFLGNALNLIGGRYPG